MECIMAACKRTGAPNYICEICGERKIFCCEGCEIELLNDLRSLGTVTMVCINHKATEKLSDRVKSIDIPDLLKRSEQFREKLISEQRFDDSVILRDLSAIVRHSGSKRDKRQGA